MERINALLQEEISKILLYEIEHIELGKITVTRVEVSKDLHYAKVFVCNLQDESADFLNKLNKIKPIVQNMIAQRVKLKFTPKISFNVDKGFEKSFRIVEILEEISDKDDGNDKQD
jgi:ribosome-binding factor A